MVATFPCCISPPRAAIESGQKIIQGQRLRRISVPPRSHTTVQDFELTAVTTRHTVSTDFFGKEQELPIAGLKTCRITAVFVIEEDPQNRFTSQVVHAPNARYRGSLRRPSRRPYLDLGLPEGQLRWQGRKSAHGVHDNVVRSQLDDERVFELPLVSSGANVFAIRESGSRKPGGSTCTRG